MQQRSSQWRERWKEIRPRPTPGARNWRGAQRGCSAGPEKTWRRCRRRKQSHREKRKFAAESVEDARQEGGGVGVTQGAEGKNDEAIAILRKLADKEDAEGGEPSGCPGA